MNGGQIWAGQRAEDIAAVPGHATETNPWIDDADGDRNGSNRIRGGTVLAIVAVTLATGWVIGMTAWMAQAGWPTGPREIAEWVALLCSVPILLAILWLVVVVGGGRYAARLTTAAAAMRAETDALERTVATLDAVIETRRIALAEQVQSLTTIGDAATARLDEIGSRLSAEVLTADRHAQALTASAGAAEARLAALLAAMPRAQEEVAVLGTRIAELSGSAGEGIADLDTRLAALQDRGREAERIAGGAAQTLAEQVGRMDATSEAAGARLAAAAGQIARHVDALLGRTAQAVEASRAGIAAQGDAAVAMLQTHQAALEAAARDSAEALARRIEIVETVIERLAARLAEQRTVGNAMATDLDDWIARADGKLRTLQRDGAARAQALAQSITALGGSADVMTVALREGDSAALKAISSAETLLIALDSAAREMDETLPGALARLDQRLDSTRQRVASTKPELLALVAAAESTHHAVDAVAASLGEQRRSAESVAVTLADGLTRGRDRVAGLDQAVETAIERVDGFVESAAPRLLEALLRVRDTAINAADKARDTLAEVIPEAAHALEIASEAAFRRAAGAGVQDQIAAVAEIAEAAVAAASRAADQLQDQLARVEDASTRLGTRLEIAQAERDADLKESFAKQAGGLIEAMNSAAIDIHRSLSPDVSDTAWSAYLKGDRGVFTRRAVRLLDVDGQRAIAGLYDTDPGFRDAVNRYIHDFEAMLRSVLAQTEGTAMAVTLLSSDIGKLYVALAQAIERLH